MKIRVLVVFPAISLVFIVLMAGKFYLIFSGLFAKPIDFTGNMAYYVCGIANNFLAITSNNVALTADAENANMKKLVGRAEEQHRLRKHYESKKSEFVAIYGSNGFRK